METFSAELAIVDIPLMNAEIVARHLHAVEPNTPIIFLSGMPREVIEGEAGGCRTPRSLKSRWIIRLLAEVRRVLQPVRIGATCQGVAISGGHTIVRTCWMASGSLSRKDTKSARFASPSSRAGWQDSASYPPPGA